MYVRGSLMLTVMLLASFVLSGCDGGFGPTLPSPDGVDDTILEARSFNLASDGQLIRNARLGDFAIEERLCGSTGAYLPAQGVRLEEDREFQPGGGQANLAVLFDHSGSMDEGPGSKLEQARAAANQLIDLKNPQDQMAIVPFDETPEVTQDFTANAQLLHDAVNAIEPGNGTAAWDGTRLGLQIADNLTAPGNRAVVLMSDGRDSRSTSTLEQTIADAQARGIPVYAIGFQTEGQANLDMRQLATQTGGQFFEAASQQELEQAFFAILGAVQGGQYTIFWRSNFEAGTNVEVRMTYDGAGEPIEIPPACQVVLGGEEDNEGELNNGFVE